MNPTFMTLLGQMITFAVLIWFTVKFIWPPLMSAIEERQRKIAEGLAAADNAQKDLAQAQDKVAEELKAARVKANEIIEQAHQRANQLIDAAKADAIAEGNRQKTLAETEIEATANRAKEELRKQVSVLAVSGAERLLKREINADDQKALIDELAAQL
jgi:F-type H+-transporting ATPase subunit b